MPEYNELVKQAQGNVNSLGEKLKEFDKLHQDIIALKEHAEEIPAVFESKFNEIVKLSTNYIDSLGGSTKIYLDGSNLLLNTKIKELDAEIKLFEKEINRLVNTDFSRLFKGLQEDFINQTRQDLKVELTRFEKASNDLQAKNDELKKQVVRLENIDFEKHFDRFQKTLAEIFQAINAINLTLTNIIPTLTGIVQSLGSIQTNLDTNHKEVKQLISAFNLATEKQFAEQASLATRNFGLLETKLKAISEQNELLKSEIKTNRIIQVLGILILLAAMAYFGIKF